MFLSDLSLAQLLQLEDFQTFDIADVDYEAKASITMLEKPEDIVAKAKQDRVELKIAKTNLEIAEKDIKIAKGAFQPSLTGFYSFSSRVSYANRILFEIIGTNVTDAMLWMYLGTVSSTLLSDSPIKLYACDITNVEIRENEESKKRYIMSKIRNYQQAKLRSQQELITGLPHWESELESVNKSIINKINSKMK